MKSYIIDTHVLIWDLKEDYIGNLSDNVKEILATEKNICVSIASLWEIAIKNNLGQLDINGTIYDIEEFCEENEIAILPIKASHLEIYRHLPVIHRDPFDRMIISQALSEKMTVITKDSKIPKYDVDVIW